MRTAPTTGELSALLGNDGAGIEQAQLESALSTVTTLARSHTRGRGFADDHLAEDLAAAIFTAAARLVVNPAAMRSYVLGGETSAWTPFVGWTLPERIVLDRYRRTAM